MQVISNAAIETLWHMLGISLRREWDSYRNYYAPADGPPSADLIELVEAGLAERYQAIDQNIYYRATRGGIVFAQAAHSAQRRRAGIKVYEYRVKGYDYESDLWDRCQGATRSKARYAAYLGARESIPDLSIVDIVIGRRLDD